MFNQTFIKFKFYLFFLKTIIKHKNIMIFRNFIKFNKITKNHYIFMFDYKNLISLNLKIYLKKININLNRKIIKEYSMKYYHKFLIFKKKNKYNYIYFFF